MGDERRKDYPNILSSINDLKIDVKNILRILNGNGEVGLVAEVKINTNNIQGLLDARKVTFSKVFDWGLKLLLAVLVLYLTTKL